MRNKRIVGTCHPRSEKTLTVYICSPFAGDIEKNVEAAKKYCQFAIKHAAMPIAPHLYFPQFMNDADPEQRADALAMGLRLLDWCHEMWVFGDIISEGMQGEIDHAHTWGIAVKYFTNDCEEIRLKGEESIDEDIPF